MTIPASTGIHGRNHHLSWCTLDLLATRPVGGVPLTIDRLANPKQNEAPDYGSAFSRGLAVTTGRTRYVVVSGTASIDDQGETIHVGDFVRQTEVTMDMVEALLVQGGAGLENVVQATAFIKRPEDVGTFQRIINELGLEDLPIVCTIADVCRDDLLFELDATAVLPATPGDEKC